MRSRFGIVLATAAFAAGVGAGACGGLFSEAMAKSEGNRSETARLFELFGEIYERVRTEYVEPINERDAIEAAINGMLQGLDPHSGYMNQRAYRDMQTQTRGTFGGLGLEVSQESGYVKVISPIDDTPAARAGIKPGDFITHINDEQTQGLTLQEAVEKMRGERGTTVRLLIRREGADQSIEATVTRDVIRPQVVRHRLEGDIGYVRISSFNEQTLPALRQALLQLKQQAPGGMKGLVLDLRNNPGGLLDQSIGVSDEFLESGEIVSIRTRKSEEGRQWSARPGDVIEGVPMVVLINAGSASASEIVAGALRDHRRGVVMGVRSFGKGSVQTVIPVAGNGAIRLTTARYYTPSGRSIQARGIEPDIEVLAQRQDEAQGAANRRDREADLRHSLRNETEEQRRERQGVNPAPLRLPAGLAERVQRVPSEGAPALDMTKPETDHQLQQALIVVRGLAAPGANHRRTEK